MSETHEACGREIERLRLRNIQVGTALTDANKEIERLREENAHFAWRDKDKNKLICELADALEDCGTKPYLDLKQRAREASKE